MTEVKGNIDHTFKATGTKYNFGAGPSILPKEVFEEASRAVVNYNDSGLSILEIGHRTKTFAAVLDEAIHTLKELMHLDSEHEVLFLHGGASTQFFQVPMNKFGLLSCKQHLLYQKALLL